MLFMLALFFQASQIQALLTFLLSQKQQVLYTTGCSAVTKARNHIHDWLTGQTGLL